MGYYFIREYGAAGDGKTNDTAAIQQAIDECHQAGGGRVVLSSGNYVTANIEIKSNVELHLEHGATLMASPNPEDYDCTLWGGERHYLILSNQAENIAITGSGTIDGNGKSYIETDRGHIYRMKRKRPFTVLLMGSNNITIENIRIVDGAVWTLTLSGCSDVLIRGIQILNDLKVPNSDGIDIDRCRNVRIGDCHLECGDDCIVFKATDFLWGKGSCENVTVTGCTMVSNSFAINIGCEVEEPIRNITVNSCVIRDSHRGIGVHLSNHSNVENIMFSNMIIETRYRNPDWWGAAEPIYVVSIPWTDKDTLGHVKHIRFSNIVCKSENGIFIQGWEDYTMDDILLDNVRIELDKWTDEAGGRHDIRPCPGGDLDGRSAGVYDYPTNGFYMKDINGTVTLRNCEVVWGEHIPDYYKHAIEAHRVQGLDLQHFKGTAAFPGRDAAIVRTV